MAVLPLLASLYIGMTSLEDYGIPFIQSLVKLSPSLRHIRSKCGDSESSRPWSRGVGKKD
jgi:hypothetical protein